MQSRRFDFHLCYISRYIAEVAAMASPAKAKVFMSGRSQAVRIPAEYRFSTDEVFIRRDSQTGDLILSQAPGGWNEIFEALDKAGVPDDFLSDRAQGMPQARSEL
jgi:antitoxin VapB